MTQREALTLLVHDVGKYLSRIARNLPDGPIPDVLAGMLAKDLYETHRGQPASARFGALQADLDPSLREPLRRALEEIDTLEEAVKRRDDRAMRRAADLALEIERRLREALAEEAP